MKFERDDFKGKTAVFSLVMPIPVFDFDIPAVCTGMFSADKRSFALKAASSEKIITPFTKKHPVGKG